MMNLSTGHHNLVCQGSCVPPPTYDLRFGFFCEQFLKRGVGLGQVCPQSLGQVRNIESISTSLEPLECTGNMKIVF